MSRYWAILHHGRPHSIIMGATGSYLVWNWILGRWTKTQGVPGVLVQPSLGIDTERLTKEQAATIAGSLHIDFPPPGYEAEPSS